MSSELTNALRMVADERSIKLEDLVDTIEQAVAMAAEKRLGKENLEARFEKETGEFDLYEKFEVVETVEEPAYQIGLDQARETDPEAAPGSIIYRQVEMEDLGRIAAQSVRQMIYKKGKALEQDRLAASYLEKTGKMVTGTVERKSGKDIFISLGDIEATLPVKERLELDRLERNKLVKVIIVGVSASSREPQAIVSRSHPNLLRELLEMETPEIAEGIVEIMSLARDNSGRSKVAVRSKKYGIDPVGACIGARGARIQPIAKELGGEKIDIFPWSEDPKELIASALIPAKKLTVIPDETRKQATVIVADDELSLAIGKKGVNIKLAIKLTGWEMDVVSQEEYDESGGHKGRGGHHHRQNPGKET